MRNKTYHFTGTNNRTGSEEVDFVGTELEYANLYIEKDWVYNVGFPKDLIKDFESGIQELSARVGSRDFDDEKIAEYQKGISNLQSFLDENGNDTPAIIISYDSGQFDPVTVLDIDSDVTVSKSDIEIEVGVQWFIDAVEDNNRCNGSTGASWSCWDNASDIIEVYTDYPYRNFIFEGGREKVEHQLEIRLNQEKFTESIVEGYLNGSDKKSLLNLAKSLTEDQIFRLEDKLEAKGIDLNKFQSDLKNSAPKMKP